MVEPLTAEELAEWKDECSESYEGEPLYVAARRRKTWLLIQEVLALRATIAATPAAATEETGG